MSAHLVQLLLDTLPVDRGCMTVRQLAEKTGLARNVVSMKCVKLVSRGLAERHGARTGCYRLTKDGVAAREAGLKLTSGPAGKRNGVTIHKNTIRARIWNALRSSQKATIPELLQLAAAGDEKDAHGNAQKYLRGLVMAGYVIKMKRREPGTALTSNGFARYFLEKNTGPKAPVIRWQRGLLFDPNLSENVELAKGGTK